MDSESSDTLTDDMEVAVINWDFIAQLGKEAADLAKATVRSESIPMSTDEGRERAAASLKKGLKPAAHVAPTRYGRKPYSRGTERDST